MSEVVLSVQGLKKYFELKKGFFGSVTGHVRAVNDVTFAIRAGEIFGLVGESGCGKSTLGLTILRAYDPTAGEVTLSLADGTNHEISSLPQKALKPLRRQMQMIFQDPYSSLSPRMTVRDIIAEPLQLNNLARGAELDDRVAEMLEAVGLNPQHLRRYPHAFSGGQRQRIGIARALIMHPRLVVADEAVSALDVSVQAQILELLLELKDRLDLTYLFISHNLSVVKYLCDSVGVMYVGKLVETARTDDLFRAPLHPYTQALISAIPFPDPLRRRSAELLSGEVADPANPPAGCYFHPRCKYAREVCRHEEPALREIAASGGQSHAVACHFAGELPFRSTVGEKGT